ncbi:MAG: hypothetical protein ABI600_14370 [Luteolibacter sp.]
MKNLLFALFFLMCSVVSLHADFHPNAEDTWPLVARSQVIVIGTLDVPVERIREFQSSGKHDYLNLTVKTDQVMKGNVAREFNVSWFTKPRSDSPDPEQVIGLNGKNVMLFLSVSHEDRKETLYFAADSTKAVTEYSEKLQQRVLSEIALQRKVLAARDQAVAVPNPAIFQKVKKLIDATTRKESQKDAFKQLEALGWDGVPSIIMLMDDDRDLAIKHIELDNHAADAFEGIRQYGPSKVVDAMAAILNQITAENFGFIYNGDDTEQDRHDCADGWMMYLYHWEKESAKLPVKREENW